jgi:very-short-patch-repair endonuclease
VNRLEARLAAALRQVLPSSASIRPQFRIGRRRADFLVSYRRRSVVVEADGEHWHGGVKARIRDWQRDRSLASVGLETLRFREKEINRNPKRCARRVARRLGCKPAWRRLFWLAVLL